MVYIIADLNLNNRNAAKDIRKTVDEYNQMIINNWNEIVNDEDIVLIFGTMGNSPIEKLKQTIRELKGNLYLMDYKSNKNFKISDWKRFGINYIWDCSLIDSVDEFDKFCIPTFTDLKNYKATKYLCLTEKHKMNTIFKDNCLNISAKYWDYTPILLGELPNIIKRMEEFSNMEEINNE